MEDLDHDAISKILGSKIKRVGRVGFGGFALVPTMEEIQEALRDESRCKELPSPPRDEGAIAVVEAVEDVPDDASK